ncbi:MAG: hypothetical protein ACSLEM_05470 [Candidatus Malihini olakiniferum]
MLIMLYKLGDALGDAFAISLRTIFLIWGVSFNADDVGLVNKKLELFTKIVGSLYGGILLLMFCIFQAISNAGYLLLKITDKNLVN